MTTEQERKVDAQLDKRKERAGEIPFGNIYIAEGAGDTRAFVQGSADAPYQVTAQDGAWQCTCPTTPNTAELPCKHILAVWQVQDAQQQDTAQSTAIQPAQEATPQPTVQGGGLYPARDEWAIMQEVAENLLDSGILPDHYYEEKKGVPLSREKQVAKVKAVMLKGRELRIPPIQALQKIYEVRGNTTCATELMSALVRRERFNGEAHSIQPVEVTNEKAVVKGKRADSGDTFTAQFTMDDATNAKLLSNPTWQKYPRMMMEHRATSWLCRVLFSDCIGGMSYTPEELGATTEVRGGEVSYTVHDETPPPEPQEPPEADESLDDEESPLEGEFEPAERLDEPSPADQQIGDDGAKELKALNRRARDAGADGDAIADAMKAFKNDKGVSKLADLRQRHVEGYEDMIHAEVRNAVFPQGEAATPDQWKAICERQGIDSSDRKALQILCFGEERPAGSPDEMAALIEATVNRILQAPLESN